MFKLGNLPAMMSGLQKLPQAMAAMTEKLRAERIYVETGAGSVQVCFNGLGEMQTVELKSENQPAEELQRWVLDACNQGHAQAKQRYAEAMHDLASELKLDGMPGFDSAMSSLMGGQ